MRPPPDGEHSGLFRYAKRILSRRITLPDPLREQAGMAVLSKLSKLKLDARALAVGSTHCHLLLHVGAEDAKPLIGRVKQFASHAIGGVMPGTVWADGCAVDRIRDEAHYRSAIAYILEHSHEGAWTWNASATGDLT